jgi:uncharacterized heparinase superfamily protein
MHLVFDHGPLGYLSIAAHGHADALAIWLSIGGEPVLIDAGTYRYHGAGAIRDRLRGTAAHNTLTVAGADQSEIAGPFNWSRKANCQVVSKTDAPWSVEAEHDGYLSRFGCIHRRRVETAGRGKFTVTDRLIGTGGPWPATIAFLIAPGLAVRQHGAAWHIGDKLRIHHDGRLTGMVSQAEFSARMGQIGTTQRLAFSGPMSPGDAVSFDFTVAV